MFQIASLLLVAVLLYGIHRIRLRKVQRRGIDLEALIEARTVELLAAYKQLEEASLTDALTGLRNRRFIQQTIGADVATVLRTHTHGASPQGGADLVFLMLDLDHFKHINDTYGHAAGDTVLVQVANILRRLLREADHVARWGGEEFLIVARFIDRRRAPELAEKIRAAVAAHIFALPDGSGVQRTCSIGFAAFPFLGAQKQGSWEAAVDVADAGLYRAKREGRNRWVDGGA